jgi:hypothetical protein
MRTRTLGLLGGSIAMASVLWLACGGSDGAAELVGTGNDGGGQPEASVTAEGGGGADAATGSDGATGSDASDGGTTTPEAGGGDGGIDPPDAGPGGTTTVINCGSTTCAIPTDTCCVDRLGGGMTAYSCATTCPGIAAGGDTTALKCSGQSNCAAGTVCCVQQVGAAGASSACQVTCGVNQAQLCAPTAAVSGCGAGVTCSNANIATCGGVGN